MDASSSTVIFSLSIPLQEIYRLAIDEVAPNDFFNASLLSKLIFFHPQEADQNIENFTHHHACVQLPEDLRHLKQLKEGKKKNSEDYKNSVSRQKQQ